MAIAYESIQSASIVDTDLVITKPTGLAVGDEMVAFITFSDDSAGGGGVNTPSGWTLVDTISTVNSGTTLTAIFRKTADSADVAASNFTFTRSGGDSTYHLIGHIVRISSFAFSAGSTSNTNVSLGSTTITATTFTPTRADCLYVGLLMSQASGGTSNTSLVMATDNPTWTERAETQQADTNRTTTTSVYTASRSAMTATGTITGTFNTSSVNHAHIILYAFAPKISSTFTAPAIKVNAYAIRPVFDGIRVDAVTDTPTITEATAPTQWSNTAKPSTTWVNTPK